MRNQDLLLMSHLMRRAGFGATTPELHPLSIFVKKEEFLRRYPSKCAQIAIADAHLSWLLGAKAPLWDGTSSFWG